MHSLEERTTDMVAELEEKSSGFRRLRAWAGSKRVDSFVRYVWRAGYREGLRVGDGDAKGTTGCE